MSICERSGRELKGEEEVTNRGVRRANEKGVEVTRQKEGMDMSGRGDNEGECD